MSCSHRRHCPPPKNGVLAASTMRSLHRRLAFLRSRRLAETSRDNFNVFQFHRETNCRFDLPPPAHVHTPQFAQCASPQAPRPPVPSLPALLGRPNVGDDFKKAAASRHGTRWYGQRQQIFSIKIVSLPGKRGGDVRFQQVSSSNLGVSPAPKGGAGSTRGKHGAAPQIRVFELAFAIIKLFGRCSGSWRDVASAANTICYQSQARTSTSHTAKGIPQRPADNGRGKNDGLFVLRNRRGPSTSQSAAGRSTG